MSADFIINKESNYWKVSAEEPLENHSSSVVLNRYFVSQRTFGNVCRQFWLSQLGVMVYATGLSG